jgi:hypothetical protein
VETPTADKLLQFRQSTITPRLPFSIEHSLLHLKGSDCTDENCYGDKGIVSIFHLNTQSLKAKIGELEILFNDIPFHLLCFNEHWCNFTDIQMYVPNNYELIDCFCRLENNYGGVSIYKRRDLLCKHVAFDLKAIAEPSNFEVVGVRFTDLKLILISIYRTPDANMDIFIDKLEKMYNLLTRYSDYNFILIGDINVDATRSKSSNMLKLTTSLQSFNWSLRNDLHTRKLACLDNIITNTNFEGLVCGTLSPNISDHLGLWSLFVPSNLYSNNHKNNVGSITKVKEIRRLGIQNILDLRRYLSSIDFVDDLNQILDINCAWKVFVQCIQNAVLIYCPKIKVSSKSVRNNNVPWFNATLYKLRLLTFYWATQYRFGNYLAKAKYNNYKKTYKKEIRKAKVEFNDKRIKSSTNTNSTIWSIVNKELTSGRRVLDTVISSDDFNDYFTKIVGSFENCGDKLTTKSNTVPLDSEPNHLNPFKLSSTSSDNVILITKKLRNSRTEDIYGLSSYILKHIIDLIVVPLTGLINRSIELGVYPDILKKSIIVPVYKKGDRNDPSNFRPIALTPIFSKVFEYVVIEQLNSYLTNKNLIDKCQYGFRPGTGTIDAVENVVRRIYDGFEGKQITVASFIDLSKAFDTISHPILLEKLLTLGIRDRELYLITSYLSNRSQVVKFNGGYSKPIITNRGVPQGSILGPLLFVIFMNDFKSVLSSTPVLYADDVTIILSHNDLFTLNTCLNQELENAIDWFNRNELSMNLCKTMKLFFSLNKRGIDSNGCKSVKMLGIYLDSVLAWHDHIDFLQKRLAKGLFALRKLKDNLSSQFLCVAFHALFQSHILYGIIFWGSSHRWPEIFILQKRAVRIILGMSRDVSCRGKFRKLGIMTVPCLFIFYCVMYVKKNFNKCKTNDMVHSHNTRSNKNIVQPYARLSKTLKSYIIMGGKFYNLLPNKITQLDLCKFKITLKGILVLCEGYNWHEIEEFIKAKSYI